MATIANLLSVEFENKPFKVGKKRLNPRCHLVGNCPHCGESIKHRLKVNNENVNEEYYHHHFNCPTCGSDLCVKLKVIHKVEVETIYDDRY